MKKQTSKKKFQQQQAFLVILVALSEFFLSERNERWLEICTHDHLFVESIIIITPPPLSSHWKQYCSLDSQSERDEFLRRPNLLNL